MKKEGQVKQNTSYKRWGSTYSSSWCFLCNLLLVDASFIVWKVLNFQALLLVAQNSTQNYMEMSTLEDAAIVEHAKNYPGFDLFHTLKPKPKNKGKQWDGRTEGVTIHTFDL